MHKIRFRTLAVSSGVVLGASALQQAFTTLLFERNPADLAQDVVLGLPLLALSLTVVLVIMAQKLAPLEAFVTKPNAVDADGRRQLRAALTQFPRLFFVANLALFLGLPLVLLLAKLVFFAHVMPGWLDLLLILSLNLAFGFLATLQQMSAFEALSIPVRRSLGQTQVEGPIRDSSLRRRLFLVNLSSVLLSGLLASMAALGFYREVVAYYTSLAADVVAAATAVSTQAVSENEVKVVVQLGLLFLAVLAWTLWLTATALATLTRQLKTLEDRVSEMADGSADLGRRAEVLFFDEVGFLTGRINAVMERLQEVVGAIQGAANHVVDSTQRLRGIATESSSSLGRVEESKVAAFQALGGQAQALGAALEVAQELERSSTEVQAAVVNQSDAVTRGASAMEQLAGSVGEVRELTVRADGLATSLRQTSEQGGRSVEAVRLAMGSIQTAAQAIGGTLATIKKTSSQTNLLAMNAAIEAAHAGDAGLGFAVVAGEVRTLAEDSSKGAKRIAELMTDMGAKIADGDRLAKEAGAAFSRIYELIVQTSEVMSTVARAMEEQKSGTDTILDSTRTLRLASEQIGGITANQASLAGRINGSVMNLLEAGAVMAMAQDVQSRATNELSELVRTISQETEQNFEIAETLGKTVSGFTVK